EQEFVVADSDMQQDQEGNLGNDDDDDDEPIKETLSKRPAFRLLKGTRNNYAELEYDFKECYKALSEKLDWENPEDDDYPFDLTKPLPLAINSEHETNENVSGFESNHQENKEEVEDEEEEEKEDEYVRTPSYYSPTDDEDKTNVDDNAEGDKDEEMDYTTNIPTTEAAIVSLMDVPVHHEVLSGQTPKLLTILVSVITESLMSSYEATALLTEFELKKILIDKIDKSESYLAAPEHRECTKSQLTSSGKSVKEEEPEFEVADTNMPQDQEGNMGNEDEEPKRKVASKRDWFTKPKQPQEPTDPEWNEGKTPQQGPTQN
nr:hypothetical protein [Tanacetum cinerariifolium]